MGGGGAARCMCGEGEEDEISLSELKKGYSRAVGEDGGMERIEKEGEVVC